MWENEEESEASEDEAATDQPELQVHRYDRQGCDLQERNNWQLSSIYLVP